MKIAFLCKRWYTGKDVISDRFGRLYELPLQLARLGHDVRGFCLDYHRPGCGDWQHETAAGTLNWESRSLGRFRLPAMLAYQLRIMGRLRRFAPDLVLGASDIPHVVLAAWLAERIGTPFAIDLYDNFESFDLARLPGFVRAYRQAIRGAGVVTVVSEPLRRKVEQEYGADCPVRVMVNGIDRTAFKKADKLGARRHLDLPIDAKLVGTAGGLQRSKGVHALYAAWDSLKSARPDVHLVLAGPIEPGMPPPHGDRVHYLGRIPQAGVAQLFSALDVGVVTLSDSEFGRYCFPQKLYEMLACSLPVVATDIGVVSGLLRDSPCLLYPPDDSSALAEAVIHQLEAPSLPALPVPEWSQLVAEIEPELRRLVLSRHRRPAQP